MLAYFSLMLISERFDRPLHFKTTNFEFAVEAKSATVWLQNKTYGCSLHEIMLTRVCLGSSWKDQNGHDSLHFLNERKWKLRLRFVEVAHACLWLVSMHPRQM